MAVLNAVTVRPGGIVVGRYHDARKGGGLRGVSQGWTKGVAARNADFLMSVEWPVMAQYQLFLFTLTRRGLAETPAEWNRLRKAWRMRIERRLKPVAWHRVDEWHTKQVALHVHGLVAVRLEDLVALHPHPWAGFPVEGISGWSDGRRRRFLEDVAARWLMEPWVDLNGDAASMRAHRAGRAVRLCDEPGKRLGQYLAKHGGRTVHHLQRSGPGQSALPEEWREGGWQVWSASRTGWERHQRAIGLPGDREWFQLRRRVRALQRASGHRVRRDGIMSPARLWSDGGDQLLRGLGAYDAFSGEAIG